MRSSLIVQAILGIGIFILIFYITLNWEKWLTPKVEEPFQAFDDIDVGDEYDNYKDRIIVRGTAKKGNGLCAEQYAKWDEIDGTCYSNCGDGYKNMGKYCFKTDITINGQALMNIPSVNDIFYLLNTCPAGYNYEFPRQYRYPWTVELSRKYTCYGPGCPVNSGVVWPRSCVQTCGTGFAKIDPNNTYGIPKEVVWDNFSVDPYTCWNTSLVRGAYRAAEMAQEEKLVDDYYKNRKYALIDILSPLSNTFHNYNSESAYRAHFKNMLDIQAAINMIDGKKQYSQNILDAITVLKGKFTDATAADKTAATAAQARIDANTTLRANALNDGGGVKTLLEATVRRLELIPSESDRTRYKSAWNELVRVIDEFDMILLAREGERLERIRRRDPTRMLAEATQQTTDTVMSFLKGEEAGGWQDQAWTAIGALKTSLDSTKATTIQLYGRTPYSTVGVDVASGSSSMAMYTSDGTNLTLKNDIQGFEEFTVQKTSVTSTTANQTTSITTQYDAVSSANASAICSAVGAEFRRFAENKVTCYGVKPAKKDVPAGYVVSDYIAKTDTTQAVWSMYEQGRYANQSEIYFLNGSYSSSMAAEDQCRANGGRIATEAELTAGAAAGASWTTPGWIQGRSTPVYPQNNSITNGTGTTAGAICYGIKPPDADTVTTPFKAGTWSAIDSRGEFFRFDMKQRLTDLYSGKCLQYGTDGTATLMACNNTDAQKWTYDLSTKRISSKADSKMVLYRAGGTAAGSAVSVKDSTAATGFLDANARWKLTEAMQNLYLSEEQSVNLETSYYNARDALFRRVATLGGATCTSAGRARYVKLRPSIDDDVPATERYLTVTQVKVYKPDGTLIPITATPTVSSSFYSRDRPQSVIDGAREARSYEGGYGWTAAAAVGDTEYMQLDLGQMYDIGYIVFFGRSDGYAHRNKGIRIELWDDTNTTTPIQTLTLTEKDKAEQVATFCKEGLIQRVYAYGEVKAVELQASADTGLDSYLRYAAGLMTGDFSAAATNMGGSYGNVTIQVPDISGMVAYLANYKQVINNYVRDDPNHMQLMATDSPINFFTDYNFIPKPNLVGTPASLFLPDITVPIFGTLPPRDNGSTNDYVTLTIGTVELMRRIYLGNPSEVWRYLRVKYGGDNDNTLRMYMRNIDESSLTGIFPANKPPTMSSPKLCMQEVVQVIENNAFVTKYVDGSNEYNDGTADTPGACGREITPDLLAKMPFPARNFIKNWLYNRRKRIAAYKYRNMTDIIERNAKINAIQVVQPTEYIDLRKTFLLDAIAQEFYEEFQGRYKMSYLYDVFTLGDRIIDVRFDVVRHKSATDPDVVRVQNSIRDITAAYRAISQSGAPENVLSQARQDYYTKLYELQDEQERNTDGDILTVTGRFFYTLRDDGSMDITGFTLDPRAVSSFIPGLNGGLTVFTPDNKQAEGNVNYEPKTRYTLNPTETFDFTNRSHIKRIMMDYMEAAPTDLSGALKPFLPEGWTESSTLYVTEVHAASRVSPMQCMIKWSETLYNNDTNQPVSATYTNMGRVALFTYKRDDTTWFSQDALFDASGFKFFGIAETSVPACVYNRAQFIGVNRFLEGKTNEVVDAYYKTRGLRDGLSPCPGTNPGARFDALEYRRIQPDLATNAIFDMTVNNITVPNTYKLLQHYRDSGIGEGRAIVAASPALQAFTPPIAMGKPPAAEATLDTLSGQCETRTCQDQDTLYSLMQKYNDNKALPGNILRIKKAVTANKNQCDVLADIDFIQKGDGPAPVAPNVGVKKDVPLRFLVTTNAKDCSIVLEKGELNPSGHAVQANTPPLYKPLEYGTKVKTDTKGYLDTALGKVETEAGAALARARASLMSYRANTLAAASDAAISLDGCPGLKCSNPDIIMKFIKYYENLNWMKSRITKVTRATTFNKTTCDFTFETAQLTIDPSTQQPATTNPTTNALRVTLRKPTATVCNFEVDSTATILPEPTWDTMKDTTKRDMNLASLYKESTVNIENNRPIRFVDCMTNKAIRAIFLTDSKLSKIIAIKNTSINKCLAEMTQQLNYVNYDKTREYTFNISDTYDYTITSQTDVYNKIIGINESGVLRDVNKFDVLFSTGLLSGCTSRPTCTVSNLDTEKGSDLYGLRVFDSMSFDTDRCIVRVADTLNSAMVAWDGTANATANAFGQLYKVVTFSHANAMTCDIKVDTVTPVPYPPPPHVMSFKTDFDKLMTVDPTSTEIHAILKEYVSQEAINGKIGSILRVGPTGTIPATVDRRIIYVAASYTEENAKGEATRFFDTTNPALMKVEFRRLRGPSEPPSIINFELISAVPAGITMQSITDTTASTLPNPVESITKYSAIEVEFTKARGSTMMSIVRFELFKNGTALLGTEFGVYDSGNNELTGLTGTAPEDIADPSLATAVTRQLPFKFTIRSKSSSLLDCDGFSFMTGGVLNQQPLRWMIRGTASGSLWKILHSQTDADAEYSATFGARLPLTSFVGREPVSLIPNQKIQPLLTDCPGIKLTDLRFVQDAANIVYNEWSKTLAGYSEQDKIRSRAFLTNIREIGYVQNWGNINLYIKPEITIRNNKMIDYVLTSATTPNIVLNYTLDAKCQITLNTSGNVVSMMSDAIPGITFQTFQGPLTGYQNASDIPFGWGGLQATQNGNYKVEGNYEVTPGAETTVVQYKMNGYTGLVMQAFGASSAQLSPEAAKNVCDGSPTCVGFNYTTTGNAMSGLTTTATFIGMPAATTRVSTLTAATATIPLENGTNFTTPTNQLYLKNPYEVFKYVRISNMKPRTATSTTIQLGKIRFYQGSRQVQATPVSVQALIRKAAFKGKFYVDSILVTAYDGMRLSTTNRDGNKKTLVSYYLAGFSNPAKALYYIEDGSLTKYRVQSCIAYPGLSPCKNPSLADLSQTLSRDTSNIFNSTMVGGRFIKNSAGNVFWESTNSGIKNPVTATGVCASFETDRAVQMTDTYVNSLTTGPDFSCNVMGYYNEVSLTAIPMFTSSTDSASVDNVPGQSILAQFDMPIIANKFTMVTGTSSSDLDLIEFKIEISLDGSNWKIIDNSSMSVVPTTRGTEMPAVLFNPQFPLTEGFESGGANPQQPQTQPLTREKGDVTEGMAAVSPVTPVAQPPPPVRYMRFQVAAVAEAEAVAGSELGRLLFYSKGELQTLRGARVAAVGRTDRPVGRNMIATAPALLDYTSTKGAWVDRKAATDQPEVVITLPKPVALDAFSMLTGADPAAAPVQWRLLGSTDGETWFPLHEQVGEDATVPTAAQTQYMRYPFIGCEDAGAAGQGPKRGPRRRATTKSPFEKTLEDAGKECMDHDLVAAVETELAVAPVPSLFHPISAVFDKEENKCTYYQPRDHTEVEATFSTNVTGATQLVSVKRKAAAGQRPTRIHQRMIAPEPLMEEETGPAAARRTIEDGGAAAEAATAPGYKFFRFRVLKTRVPSAEAAAISSLRLFTEGGKEVDLLRATASNPMGTWKGDVRDVAASTLGQGAGWRDRAKQALVLGFTEPVAATGFTWTTSREKKSAADDPVRWKLEGSTNGVYWTTLHDQSAKDFPVVGERGAALPVFRW